MSASNFSELRSHVGHSVEVVTYGRWTGEAGLGTQDEVNCAVECVDCSEVLLDFDKAER